MSTVASEVLWERIKESKQLPSPPGVAIRILSLDRKEDVQISEIARTISADPALTAKLIGYCNSPLVGLANPVSNLNQAVVALGMRTLKMLALSFSFLDPNKKELHSSELDEFWNRSLAHAVATQVTCQAINKQSDDAFIAALVSQIGHLAVYICCKEEYDKIEQIVDLDRSRKRVEVEREILGMSCYEISQRLLVEWGFPDSTVSLVSRLDPSSCEDGKREIDHALTLALDLSKIFIVSSAQDSEVAEFRERASEKLGLGEVQQDYLFDDFLKNWCEYAKILSYDESKCKPLSEIQSEAQSRLFTHSVELQQENTVLKRDKIELAQNALTDSLTGLGNRRAFEQRASEELDMARKARQSFVMLVIDIDHFKNVNDTYGHLAGDAILKYIADSMKFKSRRYDLIFRYGGEEFVVLLPDCNSFVACAVAERFRRVIEESEFEFDGQLLRCTISIGIAVVDYPNYPSFDTIFAKADKALYCAKNSGRNTFYIDDYQSNESDTFGRG